MESCRIRVAQEQDAGALLKIYAPYVEKTAVTFEYTVPGAEEFAGRIARTLQKYPYLLAERAGQIVGYAYAGPFHARAAYDWAVETSVYVRQDQRKMGTGRALYHALEDVLRMQNILNVNACIELWDVIHACETLMRRFDQNIVGACAHIVEAKNAARGYYGEVQ